MPYRHTPFIAGETYHVFNRSIAKQQIFNSNNDYERILELINYYRFKKLPLRYSHYKRLEKKQKAKFTDIYMSKGNIGLEILAYCIMPNHFHFLIRPLINEALSDFMRNMQNGYSKYFNLKYERTGSLFQFMFKAVRIETDEQLVHVSRYIHLNPITAFLIKINDLEVYSWSSFKDYLLEKDKSLSFIETRTIISQFVSNTDYKNFVIDQIDYQRELGKIKHLTRE